MRTCRIRAIVFPAGTSSEPRTRITLGEFIGLTIAGLALGAIYAGGDVERMVDRGILATQSVGTAISLGAGASAQLPAGTMITVMSTAPAKNR